MAATVTSLQPVRFPKGPSLITPEQLYWRTFKSQLLTPSPANNPINHISCPALPSDNLAQISDHFAVSTGLHVQIFSIRTRRLVKTISRFDDVARGANIRRDGRVIVAGDDGGNIQVFDINSRAILKTWKEHKQPVWCTKFSPSEATTLMSTSDDKTVRLWDLPSQESTCTFMGHQDYVRAGAFMAGQATSLLVSGSYDQTVKLWDPRKPSTAAMTFKHAAPIECVLPMPSGTTVLATSDNQIIVLDLVAGRPIQILKNHQKTVTSLSLASNGARLVSGGLDGHVKVSETTGWNVVTGSKYPSPILSLAVIGSGAAQNDHHLVVGMQSGMLSIKTRLSGQQKVKERERQKEMQALLDGTLDEHDKKEAKKQTTKGWEKRLRGRDFTGEGADIIIGGKTGKRKRLQRWEELLRKGNYGAALDLVLEERHPTTVVTLLTALRHRSAMRTAIAGRDDVSLQPIFKWICVHIRNPRYVTMCVDIGILILDLYSPHMGESEQVDTLMRRLHQTVQTEVKRAQQAWHTSGMLEMLMDRD